MKKLTLILTLALSTLAPTFASAEVPLSDACPKIAEVARLTMEARQVGVPMRTLMELAETPISVSIITEAYGHPAYNTPEYQEKAIQDFEDRWYRGCVKAYNQ